MKVLYKIALMLISFAMIVPLGIGISAEEEFDAFKINDEEASEYKFKFDDTAVKMFSGIFCYDFAEGTDVYDIVKASDDKTAYIITSDKMIEIRYKDGDQVVTAPISCLIRSCLSQICVFAKNHDAYFDADVEVINTYIFHEMWGFSVYFVTNKGNFVMYKESMISEEIYLLPDGVYRECAEGMVNFIRSTEGGSCPSYAYFADISEYQIYPERLPEITLTPDTEPTIVPSTSTATDETPTPETTLQKEHEETPEPTDRYTDKESSAGSVSVLPIIVASAIPTVILGVIVILLLKRR